MRAIDYGWFTQKKRRPISFQWKAINWYGETEDEGTGVIEPDTLATTISINPKRFGMHKIVVKLENGEESGLVT